MVRSFAILPVAALALAVSACGGAEDTKPSRPVTTTTSTTSSSASSGSGSGGSTGEGGSGGATGQGGAGGAGQGGAGGEGGATASSSSGGIDNGIPAACQEDLAFSAISMAFSSPTPQPLAAALNELVYGKEAEALSLVINFASSGPRGAISATIIGPSGSTFLMGKTPTLSPIAPVDGQGFTTKTSQASATLRLTDSQGVVDLELNDVRWTGVLRQSCNRVLVAGRGYIPKSQKNILLHTSHGTIAIADYLGEASGSSGAGGGTIDPGGPGEGSGGGAIVSEVHFTFEATSVSFDFTSL